MDCLKIPLVDYTAAVAKFLKIFVCARITKFSTQLSRNALTITLVQLTKKDKLITNKFNFDISNKRTL